MALTNEELQQILSGLSSEEQKALFEKLRQTYGDTPTPQPHPKPTSSTSKVYCCIKCGSVNYKKNGYTHTGMQHTDVKIVIVHGLKIMGTVFATLIFQRTHGKKC